MLLLLTLMLALDSELGSRPSQSSKSAASWPCNTRIPQLDSARDLYKKGDVDACRAALGEVEAGVQLSYDSLMATGKDPRRNSKPFKDAEKATRQILRRLDGLSDLMSALRPRRRGAGAAHGFRYS